MKNQVNNQQPIDIDYSHEPVPTSARKGFGLCFHHAWIYLLFSQHERRCKVG